MAEKYSQLHYVAKEFLCPQLRRTKGIIFDTTFYLLSTSKFLQPFFITHVGLPLHDKNTYTWVQIVEQISGKIWHNRGFNDKSVKTSKIVHLDLLNKIGYGPIA